MVIKMKDASRFEEVIPLKEWCERRHFSYPHARRLIKEGRGPRTVRLSANRIGVRASDDQAWLESRAVEPEPAA
jgi:predicted DNA-binding transcriptional regulator AlpA